MSDKWYLYDQVFVVRTLNGHMRWSLHCLTYRTATASCSMKTNKADCHRDVGDQRPVVTECVCRHVVSGNSRHLNVTRSVFGEKDRNYFPYLHGKIYCKLWLNKALTYFVLRWDDVTSARSSCYILSES